MTVTNNFWQNVLLGIAVAAGIVMLAGSSFAADVPKLDVTSACRAAAGADIGVKYDTARCLKSENEAHDQLAAKWTTFPAADRTLCTQTATMGGTASYVELITCLEMKQAVFTLPPDLGLDLQSRPSSLPNKP